MSSWRTLEEDFRKDFIGILKNGTDFEEYNFECPPANHKTSGDNSYPFEFILMKSVGQKSNELPTKPTECNNEKTQIGKREERIKGQENDSTLVFPCPQVTSASAVRYGHLATFVQGEQEEVMSVFKNTTNELYENIHDQNEGDTTKWYLSSRSISSGKINNWVHLRIDQSPKYYLYNPYKTM